MPEQRKRPRNPDLLSAPVSRSPWWKVWRVAGSLAVLVIGLSGCGGSSHRSLAAHTTGSGPVAPGGDPGAHRPAGARSNARQTTRQTTSSASATITERAGNGARVTHNSGPVPVKRRVATAARASQRHTPAACLKFAGLGHIRSAGHDRWQGTTGENSTNDLNGSVFVQGGYRSAKAAEVAATSLRHREIAFPGGRFVVTATTRSYLSATVSLAAACLSAGTGGLHF